MNRTPSTLNPKPSTLNPPPQSFNPQPQIPNPQPSTLHLTPSTLNPNPHTLNQGDAESSRRAEAWQKVPPSPLNRGSDDVPGDICPRYSSGAKQWLRRHSQAGSSWPSWPKASILSSEKATPQHLFFDSHLEDEKAKAIICPMVFHIAGYRGTSLIRNTLPVGPYSSPMPRDLR